MKPLLPRRQVRELTRLRTWWFWLAGWVGLAVLAFVNGTVRVVVYQDLVGETAARQIATNLLIIMIGVYTVVLHRRCPLPDTRAALAVGMAWTALTLAFEFGVGHYVFGTAWAALLADYDLVQGRLWILVPIATLLAPALVRAGRRNRRPEGR
ncbi:hypothetical protein [Pseudonocardia parietis]|uniref:Uncharacterized protein n=1 Tax=Pseudonocardia parietis TaxID=570936 RepID=A0ABS4VW33_9PSEU|nr:hypothetical protein [Pseudonocardia parietis]MBP2368144.1 hypothetical protein [Pseudonocardia parietis]